LKPNCKKERAFLLKMTKTYLKALDQAIAKDKKNKSYLYLLDQAMGIEAYSRLSANLKAELITILA